MSAPATSARRTTRTRRALIVLASFAIGLALAELGHRGWLAAAGRAHDAAAARAEFERLASQAGDLTPRTGADDGLPDNPPGTEQQARFLHPFLGWEQRSSLKQWDDLAPRLRAPRDEREIEIVVTGGSVSEIFAGQASGALMRQLLDDPRFEGRRLRVRSWGRGGWKAPQPLHAVQWLLQRGAHVDAVILIDGFNEVALAAENAELGILPALPSAMHWSALAAAGTLDASAADLLCQARAGQRAVEAATSLALRQGHARSSLLSAYSRARAERGLSVARTAFREYGRRAIETARREALRGAPFDADLAAVIPDAVAQWEECSRQLAAICAARGIVLLHVLQPTLHDEGAKPRTAEELANGALGPAWRTAVERGYPLLRERAAAMAREGLPVVDATRVFASVEETLYFDACHFGPAGNRILGTWVGERFLERWPR